MSSFTESNSVIKRATAVAPTTSSLEQPSESDAPSCLISESEFAAYSGGTGRSSASLKIKRSSSESPSSLDLMQHHQQQLGGLTQSLNLLANNYQHQNSHHHHHQQLSKSPFLLPAQFYKNLFASAMLQQNKASCEKLSGVSQSPFPRNLLYSCGQRSPGNGGDIDGEVKVETGDQVSFEFELVCGFQQVFDYEIKLLFEF